MATKKIPKKFDQHLAEAPSEFLEQKLSLLKTTPQELKALDPVVICGLKGKLAEIRPEYAKPKLIDIVSHTRKVSPRDLGELKELVGAPMGAFDQPVAAMRERAMPRLEARALSRLPQKITISRLKGDERALFFRAADSLLHGPVDAAAIDRAGYKQVIAAMLRAAREIPAFVAPDLVVCDGQTVDFSGYATLYFNNVVVEGSGRIILGNNTKLRAYQVTRI